MFSPGDKLDGKYIVVSKLGGGGFGEVFLANDEAIPGRQIAIKVLKDRPESDQNDLTHEMRMLAQLNLPGSRMFLDGVHEVAIGEALIRVRANAGLLV